MADLTPNDNPKPIAGGPPPASNAGDDTADTKGNGEFPAAAGAHKSVGRWQRRIGTTRRWTRETFNREQLSAGLKQLLWVAPLTMLIWIYAERAQQVDDTIRVTIAAHSSDPKIAVRLLDPPDGSVLMNVTGPRSRLDELHRSIESRPTPVRFEVPPGLPTGTQQLLEVKQSVAADSRFAGVTVTGSQPPRVSVAIDRLHEQMVQVQLRPEDQGKFEQAVFVPSEVKVSVPAKTLEGPLKNSLVVYADLSNFPDMTPGPKDVRGIPLKVDKAENLPDVTIEPATVTVSLVVRQANQPLSIVELAVTEETVSSARNGYRIRIDPPTLFDVKLEGPPDAMATIDPNPLKRDNVRAVVRINQDELQRSGTLQKEVHFYLPPGVRFVSARTTEGTVGPPVKIEVQIQKESE